MKLYRILAIDHGDARIGLAVSDDLGMLAHPLETLHLKTGVEAEKRIAAIVADRGIETIVVGLPLCMDGTEGTATVKVRAFVTGLKKELPEGIAIVEVDERLSTVAAQAQLHASGRTVKNSRGLVDQAAACVILQDYLDTLNPPPLAE